MASQAAAASGVAAATGEVLAAGLHSAVAGLGLSGVVAGATGTGFTPHPVDGVGGTHGQPLPQHNQVATTLAPEPEPEPRLVAVGGVASAAATVAQPQQPQRQYGFLVREDVEVVMGGSHRFSHHHLL